MNILDLVGNTPLLELPKISLGEGKARPGEISLYAKAEFRDPSGSVKDRAAKAMLLAGLAEGKGIMRQDGAGIVETGPLEGSDGACLVIREEAEAHPERCFYPNQYNNDANWQAHYRGRGPEIWEESGGKLTHFIRGMGTSGTFTGTSRRIKELNPAVTVIAVRAGHHCAQPVHRFFGLEGGVRPSLAFYNTFGEIDRLAADIREIAG
jgi:cysteine synthase B